MIELLKNWWFKLAFSYKRTCHIFVIDPKIMKDGETKIESVWSWKKMRTEKFAITRNGKKVNIQKVG